MRFPRPEKEFFPNLFHLAIPMMLQNLVTFAVGFADNLMVGTLGESAISGVYLGNQPQTLLQIIVIGVDSALLILAAQYWGRKDTESIKKLFAIAIRFAAGLAFVFTVVVAVAPNFVLSLFSQDASVMEQGVRYLKFVCWSYLFFASSQLLITSMKSVEYVRIGMYASFISLSVNVVLNYILIFGKLGLPAMGVSGAALATLISRILEFCVVFIYVFLLDKRLKLKAADLLHVSRPLLKDYLKYGAPVIAGQVVWGLNNNVQSAIIGSMGPSATSSVSLASMMFQMLTVVMFALSGSVGILTGKLVGTGQRDRVIRHAKFVQVFFLTLGLFFCGFILLMRRPFISLYTLTPETQAMAYQFLTVFAFTFIGTCYQGFSLGSLVKSGGDTRFVFINDTIFVWGIVIPSALIALHVFHAVPWIVYLCLKSDELLKCIVAVFKINSFNWIKNLTRSEEAISAAEEP